MHTRSRISTHITIKTFQLLLIIMVVLAISTIYVHQGCNINKLEMMKKSNPGKHLQNESMLTKSDAEDFRTRAEKVSINHIYNRSFVSSEEDSVFIFGAVVRPNDTRPTEFTCNIYGNWVMDKFKETKYVRCCFRFTNNKMTKTIGIFYGKTWSNNRRLAPLTPWFVTCPVSASIVVKIDKVSIVKGFVPCSHPSINFVTPYYPEQHKPGYMVISTKTAHEKLDPGQIVAQFETFRILGVDRVVTYIEDTLWEPALKVFDYYASIGFLEMHFYELADIIGHPRRIINQTAQIFADQLTVTRDAVERNSGATYFGILDNDEFPIPTRNLTLKETLYNLDLKYPNAAALFYTNQHFFTDFKEKNCFTNCTILQKYMRTAPGEVNLIHRKMISHPSRIQTGTLSSHKVSALPGYRNYILSKEDVYIRHYGSCKRKFEEDICNKPKTLRKDKSVMTWASATIDEKIKQTLEIISVL